MRGAIPPLPNTPSWCGAQLKHRDNFTFTFALYMKWDLIQTDYNIGERETEKHSLASQSAFLVGLTVMETSDTVSVAGYLMTLFTSWVI
jgi:hypothetical protein